MNFEYSEEQKMLLDMIRSFGTNEVAPGAAARDDSDEFDRELYDRIAGLGLAGICFPEEYGGAGGDMLTYTMAIEELCKHDAGMGVALATSVSLCAWPIWSFGTEEQKEKYLRPLAEGKHLGAFALTESYAGTDAAAQHTTAILDGDYYTINGSKIFSTNGGEAETYVVFAMTDKTKGREGISAFILEKGMPGFIFGKKESKMGIHSAVAVELIFNDVKVHKSHLLGQEGQGFKIAKRALEGVRISVAAQALGIAGRAMDEAKAYSEEREQFGKSISKNQAIAIKLADMATEIDAARLLTYRAAWRKDQGLPCGRAASMAKLFASDTAMKTTVEAVQIFGGYGYVKDYPMERLMRDAKITQIFGGTNETQRMVVSGTLFH